MRAALLALALFCACQSTSPDQAKTPPILSSDSCTAMCDHIGPKGLNCPEGQPVYDSAQPGPPGVPNESCEEFCIWEQTNGADLNPKCVAQAPTCADIETWRQKTCQ